MLSLLLRNGKAKDDGFVEANKQFISKLLVEIASEAKQQKIINLVENVRNLRRLDSNADTSDLEAQIDVLVYRLYGLTYAEVLVVDEDFGMSEAAYND